MFHLQPGTGLGYTGSRELAFGLGGTDFDVTIPEFPASDSGRFHKYGYLDQARIEDEEILLLARAFIEIIKCR